MTIAFACEAHAALLRAALPTPPRCATTRAEVIAAIARDAPAAVFVDLALLPQLDGATGLVPVIGLIDDATLAGAVASLHEFPRLSHLVTVALLAGPLALGHVAALLERLAQGHDHVLAATAIGRAALLSSSTRREARFERMREFFGAHDVPGRTIAALVDVAEELVTNALYDAPAEAGYFKAPVPRTEQVELPPEHACEISYGLEDGTAFVRIRDPFGALTRARMLGVLDRCSAAGVALDESRGGAGLGLWRVFSTASTVAITVIPGRLTDILVRIETRKPKGKGKAKRGVDARGVHLFFPDEHALDGAQGRFAADHDHDLLDESFTALCVA